MRTVSAAPARRASQRFGRVMLLTLIGLIVLVAGTVVILNWVDRRSAAPPATAAAPADLLPLTAPVNPIVGGHDMDHIPDPAAFTPRRLDASASQPNVELPMGRFDWGTIPVRPTVQTTLRIQNTGNEPLLITRVVTSCGCTTAALSSSVIPPGRRADLLVTFDPAFHATSGPVTRLVWLETNDPDQPLIELQLDANVVP